jgi:hypothetical protein
VNAAVAAAATSTTIRLAIAAEILCGTEKKLFQSKSAVFYSY